MIVSPSGEVFSMYCSGCGSLLPPSGSCGRCGPAAAPPPAPAPSAGRRLGIGLFLMFGFFGLLAALDRSAKRDPSLAAARIGVPAATAQPDLAVQGWRWQRGEFGQLYLVGTLQNTTDRRYGYVQVNFNLYDAAGTQIGNAWANVNNLEPHGVWQFQAIVLEPNAAKASLNEVSGF